MALLEVKGLTKTFKKKRMSIQAVDNASFTIEAGECLGLVGESGSGKSTAAAIIARLLREDSGAIEFDGKAVNASRYLAPVGRGLQMVFQNPQDSFDPRDTVLEGIMQGAVSYGIWDKQTLREKALEIFDFVGLKQAYMNMKTSELSGGECQRAAIARAIICEPKLVICDEATSALDVLVQAQVINLLKRLKTEKGMSLLFITHDLPLAASLCDRIAVMHQGKIVEIGDTWSVLHTPCSEYTQALINCIIE